MAVSVFDLFKIGIGPSSSHTVGPMRAARQFARSLHQQGELANTARVRCWLYGSLGATGKGHGSDTAVILGLGGHEPDTVAVDAIPGLLAQVRVDQALHLLGEQPIVFVEREDLLFMRSETLPFHSNGMRFSALAANGQEISQRTYYSVGGGFIVSDTVAADGARHKVIAPDATVLPLPFKSGDALLALAQEKQLSIAQIMRINERHWRSDSEIDTGLQRLWQAMQDCVERGCRTDGVLPGGFKVRRRAAPLPSGSSSRRLVSRVSQLPGS